MAFYIKMNVNSDFWLAIFGYEEQNYGIFLSFKKCKRFLIDYMQEA